MRIIGYVRLSRASREESTSIERQRELIVKTCEARGFELVETIEDVDVSATRSRLDRPGLNEVRRRIRAGEADAVLVWRLDRLVRSVVDLGVLLDEGLQIISASENDLDTTPRRSRATARRIRRWTVCTTTRPVTPPSTPVALHSASRSSPPSSSSKPPSRR